MESFVFEQHILFRVDSLCDLRVYGLVPPGGVRGQNLEHLRFFFDFFAFNFLNAIIQLKQQVPFRNDFLSVTSDCRVQCPRVGLEVKM